LLSIVLVGAAFFFAFQGVKIQADYLKIDEQIKSSMELVEMELSLSVGELVLESESRTGKLIYGNITPGTVLDDLEETRGRVSYLLESTKPTFFPHTARWELGISPELPMELDVSSSVGEIILALYGLDLDSLTVNQGVGRIVVNLPETVLEDVSLKQGVGLIEVEIPDDIRIAVDAQNGLTKVNFPADFELEDGYYTTPGATRGNADLLITVEQGIGLVTFQYAE
jgi:hypothetical protein